MFSDMFAPKGPHKDLSKEIEEAIKKLTLPEKIKMVAIYKIYKDIKKIDELKDKEVKAIEKKFLKLDEPVITAQSTIISGEREIRFEEVKNAEKFLTEEELGKVKENLGARRIPEYWARALKTCDVVKEEIKVTDQEALKNLRNIRVVDQQGTDNFQIVFQFDENIYFSNKELTKKYFMKDDYPTKSVGTVINWKEGKDLTKKEMKKKQKNKKTGQNRVINKIVDADSFFNLFRSIDLPEGKNPMEFDENEQALSEKMDIDFEVGGAIVDECIPYSLEYYLGIKSPEGEDDEDEMDQEDSDEEEEEAPKQNKKKKAGAAPQDDKVQKPECKQQ